MNIWAFCSLLPHGSAVTYNTPGSVCSALNGATPGSSFWISDAVMVVAERVLLAVTMIASAVSPVAATGAASSARTDAADANVAVTAASDSVARRTFRPIKNPPVEQLPHVAGARAG